MKTRRMIKKAAAEEDKDERWSNSLPQHILQLVVTLLQLSDYQAFRHVCTSWRAAVKDGIANKTFPPAPQLPWLLLRSTDYSRYAFHIEPQIRKFIRDPNTLRSLASSSFSMTNCLGSVGSWLIMAAKTKRNNVNTRADVINFMFNPLTGARVMLPSQSAIPGSASDDVSYFKKVVASSAPPGVDDDDGEPLVAGVTSDEGLLVYCRPSDASWTVVLKTVLTSNYKNVEIIGRRIFAYVKSRYSPLPMIMEFKISPKDVKADLVDVTWLPYIYKWSCTTMVIDSETKALFVVLFRIAMKNQSSRNGLFKVFKLGPKINNERKWEEVCDLGDRMLFLSDKSNMVIYEKSLGKNCIHFGFAIDFRGGYGVYSLESRKIKPLGFRKESKPWNMFEVQDQTLWFRPHPWS